MQELGDCPLIYCVQKHLLLKDVYIPNDLWLARLVVRYISPNDACLVL